MLRWTRDECTRMRCMEGCESKQRGMSAGVGEQWMSPPGRDGQRGVRGDGEMDVSYDR